MNKIPFASCSTWYCLNDAYNQTCGYCPKCWIKMGQDKQDELRIVFGLRRMPAIREIEKHVHQHFHPPVPLWHIVMAAAIGCSVMELAWTYWPTLWHWIRQAIH